MKMKISKIQMNISKIQMKISKIFIKSENEADMVNK